MSIHPEAQLYSMNNKNNNAIPILSFYSGGGFLDMGFEMGGFEIVWTNEIDSNFAKLHAAGITSWRKSKGDLKKAEIINTKSITEISSKEIIHEAFSDIVPNYFGIIGGPPCQDFTLHGKMEGFNGARGKLTIEFFDKILELGPTFFVMENVTGLTKNKDSKKHLLMLLERINEKYKVDFKILNALDFGVPQHRERIFFIGIKREVIEHDKAKVNLEGNWFNWPQNRAYSGSENKYEWPKAIPYGKRLKKPKHLPIKLCVQNCLVSNRDERKIPNADEYFNLYVEEEKLKNINEGETNRPSFKRLHRFKFSPTACYGNNEVHLHPYRQRRLSVRETLRIQGVPDTYVLPKDMPLTSKFKMIGNGVPVPLAYEVSKCVMKFLKDITF